MSKEILTIGDIEIEKQNFTDLKVLFFKKNVDIEKVLVSRLLLVKRTISTLVPYTVTTTDNAS